MSNRVCSEPGCPTVYPKAYGARCPDCAKEHERKRGTRQQRGYDNEHDRLRRRWAPVVARGRTPCAKCGALIARGTSWDLGHNDERTAWTGPEHTHCNRSEGGRKAHHTPGG
jgi:hypothetical protein